jgi:hypothetical protein
MERIIGIKELYSMASQMKYYEFENWVANELFNQPSTVDTSELTDKLHLSDGINNFSDKQIESLILELDKYASDYDKYEYGLPTEDAHMNNLKNIVKIELNIL